LMLKIKEGLGGRIRLMLSGAAPLPRHIEEFMRVTGCSVLAQGYGENVRIVMKSLRIITTLDFLHPWYFVHDYNQVSK
jgi:hypothetical protein